MRLLPQTLSPGRLSKPARWSRALLAVFVTFLGANSAFAVGSTTVVISQIYGGGGNAGSVYYNDFVELHNISTSSVSLAGWSLQYASSTGTFSSGNTTALSGSIKPGGYFLVKLANGSTNTGTLPLEDATGGLSLSGTGGKIALVSSISALVPGDFTGTSPTGPSIVDFVGWGTTASAYEGTGRAGATANGTSISRKVSGTTDTNDNLLDFDAAATPVAKNSSSAVFPADVVSPVYTALTPADDATSVGIGAPFAITFNEPIFKGTGFVTVKLAADDSTVFNIDVTTASVSTSGLTATITLPGPLVGSTNYYVTVDNGAFKDAANNVFAGISGTTLWSFTTALVDNTPPVATLDPLDDSTNQPPASNLVITYNESILVGSGNILLKKTSDNSLVESLLVPGSRVTVSETSVTIDPTATLDFGTGYYLEVPSGIVTDQALNPSAVIAAGAWSFTTSSQPDVLISQYYEGAGSSRYIELKNLTGGTISLNDYRLTVWSNSDPAGNQGWKSGSETTPRVTALTGQSIPPNGYFLVVDSGASSPEYPLVNNDLVVNNNPAPGATAFSGSQSIVLYSDASNGLASIADAVSFVNNDGVDKTFYRLNDSIGFDFSLGSSILDYTSTWASDKTLADVASALVTDAWYLRASNLPEYLGLSISPTSFSEGTVGTAATATVTRTGSVDGELDVVITVSDTSEATADEFVTFGIGEDTVTFPIAAADDPYLDGPQTVTVSVSATGYLSSSQQITVEDEETDMAFPVVINEVDSDQADLPSDAHEFVELYNNSASPVSLDGTVLVLYNGNGNTSYLTIDLSGYPDVPAYGYFVVGNAAVTNVSATFASNTLQNGGDGVALYLGTPNLFPNGTPVATTNGTLVDAVVYNNGQVDGATLVTSLTLGKPQVNESAASTSDPAGSGFTHSISRYPDGGVPFDTTLYVTQLPTPGATNLTPGFSYATWQSANGASGGANADSDNDGVKNGVEYFFGATGATFTPTPAPDAMGVVSYPYDSNAKGATYKLFTSPDLFFWSDVTVEADLNTPGFVKYSLLPGQGKIFLRMEVVVGP